MNDTYSYVYRVLPVLLALLFLAGCAVEPETKAAIQKAAEEAGFIDPVRPGKHIILLADISDPSPGRERLWLEHYTRLSLDEIKPNGGSLTIYVMGASLAETRLVLNVDITAPPNPSPRAKATYEKAFQKTMVIPTKAAIDAIVKLPPPPRSMILQGLTRVSWNLQKNTDLLIILSDLLQEDNYVKAECSNPPFPPQQQLFAYLDREGLVPPKSLPVKVLLANASPRLIAGNRCAPPDNKRYALVLIAWQRMLQRAGSTVYWAPEGLRNPGFNQLINGGN